MEDGIKNRLVKELVAVGIWIVFLVIVIFFINYSNKPKILILQDHDVNDSVTIVRWIEDGKVQDCPVFCEEEVERVHAYLKRRAR